MVILEVNNSDMLVQFINMVNDFLPLFLAILLIFCIILVSRLIKLVDEITSRIKQLEPTLRNVDLSMEKIQAPLDTAVNLAHSVDKVHEKCESAIKDVTNYAANSLVNIKEYFNNKDNLGEEDVVDE